MTLLSIQSDGVGRVTEVILNLVLINLDVVYEEQRVDDGQEDCFDVDLDSLRKRRSIRVTDLVFCKLKATYKKRKENENISKPIPGYEMKLAKSLAQNRLDESNDPLQIPHVTK